MPEFLELLPPTEALALLLKNLPAPEPRVEEIATAQAYNRVTARAVTAPEPLPGFDRSTVDGYAVRGQDTYGASDALPAYLTLIGESPMGSAPNFTLGVGQAALIHTGGMLPDGADAVVMLEYTQSARQGEIEVLRAVAGGENVLHTGEDVQVGDTVIPAGRQLRSPEIGGLMALGLVRVPVVVRPRVGILSSGDEVILPERSILPGQVRDVNTYTLSALVEKHGGEPRGYGIIPDRREAMQQELQRAWEECDVVVVTAGSSASTRDLTAEVIDEMGEPGVLVHGVNVKPGKPTILAVSGGKPIIGLPGNPVSALVIARLFVAPVIERWLGISLDRPHPAIPARLSVNLASQAGREDWVPVRLTQTAAGFQADPIFYKSNLIFTLAQADGMIHIPADATGLEVGAEVMVDLL